MFREGQFDAEDEQEHSEEHSEEAGTDVALGLFALHGRARNRRILH